MKGTNSILLVLFIIICLYKIIPAQILSENFDYGNNDGDLISISPDWSVHSGTGNPEQYLSTSLTYPGYLSFEVGGSVLFAGGSGSRQDINRKLRDSIATTSTIYVSFLVNLTSAGNSDYFFHLGPSSIGSSYRARLFARDTSSGSGWKLGLSKSAEGSTEDYKILKYNHTYLLVLKYEFNTSATNDDEVTLYAYENGIPFSEPGSSIVSIGPVGSGTGSDPANIGTIAIRQGTTTATGVIDGIRVDTTWNIAQPSPIASAFFPIDSLKVNGANGKPVKLEDTISTTGIITSILQSDKGTFMPATIQNENTGISFLVSTCNQTANVEVGDSVFVANWKVIQNYGLTCLEITDSSRLEILSSDHVLVPLIISIPVIKNQSWNGFEKYEGMLIKISSVHFVQSGFFRSDTSSAIKYQIVNSSDTLDLRIAKTDKSLLGKNIPTGDIKIVGILKQWDPLPPYDMGYYILPRDSSGIASLTRVEGSSNNLPVNFQLYQNYPNPFNPATTISYSVPTASLVTIKVYDGLGREIVTLVNEQKTAGTYDVRFTGRELASGVYFYRIVAVSLNGRINFASTKKLILMK